MTETIREYSADEKRVSEYIQRITDGAIGSGDDPIGFLIASHAELLQVRKHAADAIAAARADEREQCARIALSRDAQGSVPDSGCYSCFDQIAKVIRKRGTTLYSGTAFGDIITIKYRDRNGVVAEHKIVPKSIWFGRGQWYVDQLLLSAYDMQKETLCDFIVKDIVP